MARPERNNVDYFPHSVSHGKKMHHLREKFGNDAYVVWFMLLEELGKADYHYLNLSDDIQLMYLSSQFKVTEIFLKEIINTLVKMDNFDAELWESSLIIYDKKFVESVKDAYSKRRNECIDKKQLLSHLDSLGILKHSKLPLKPGKCILKGAINPQSRVEDRIGEESIVNIVRQTLEFFNSNCGTNYKSSTKKTQQLIQARQAEGFTLEDFFSVIRKKSREWIKTDMVKFLRPETLFGTKFEGYLNQPEIIPERQGSKTALEKQEDEWDKIEESIKQDQKRAKSDRIGLG